METTQNLFGFEQIEASTESNSTLIIEEIRKEVQGYLLEESDNTDSTDRVFDFLSTLYEKIQEEFHKLLDGDSNKKCFLRTLTRIFAF